MNHGIEQHMATRQAMFGLRVPFSLGATRHRVVIPVVKLQFRLVGMTTLWRVAVKFAYPIIWHTAILGAHMLPHFATFSKLVFLMNWLSGVLVGSILIWGSSWCLSGAHLVNWCFS